MGTYLGTSTIESITELYDDMHGRFYSRDVWLEMEAQLASVEQDWPRTVPLERLPVDALAQLTRSLGYDIEGVETDSAELLDTLRAFAERYGVPLPDDRAFFWCALKQPTAFPPDFDVLGHVDGFVACTRSLCQAVIDTIRLDVGSSKYFTHAHGFRWSLTDSAFDTLFGGLIYRGLCDGCRAYRVHRGQSGLDWVESCFMCAKGARNVTSRGGDAVQQAFHLKSLADAALVFGPEVLWVGCGESNGTLRHFGCYHCTPHSGLRR